MRTLTSKAALNRARFELGMIVQMIGNVPIPDGPKARRALRYYRRFFRRQTVKGIGYRLVFGLIFLSIASTAHAQQDTPHRLASIAPYVAMITGNVADLVTTKNAFDRGAVEGNPLTGFSGQQRIAPLLAEKVVATTLEAYMMHALERSGHPRIAKVMGYAAGAVTFSAAIYAHRWNQ